MAPFKRTTIPAHYHNGQTFGRPSEFRQEYCQLVIDKMAEGLSLTAFAGFIRVSRNTVYEWIKSHADFADAVSRGNPARVLWWELKIMRARKGAETSASMFALKNACPDEWRDIKHQEHNHHHTVETLTDAQLYAIAGQSGAVIDGEFSRVEPESATG